MIGSKGISISDKSARTKRLISRLTEVVASEDPDGRALDVLAASLGCLIGVMDTTFQAKGRFLSEVSKATNVAMPKSSVARTADRHD